MACVLYAFLLAVPFVPAVEIGLMIMLVFGPWGALGAYLATVIGLNFAFLVGGCLGRLLPGAGPPAPVSVAPRTGIAQSVPRAIGLVLLLNLPGNVVLGGGGGIAMAVAAQRMLPWPLFAVTVGLATAAVPLLFTLGATELAFTESAEAV